MSRLGASSQCGQVWLRTHFPNFFVLPGRVRLQAKKTGPVLVRTSEREKASHFKS
jgi:hypothetical protein